MIALSPSASSGTKTAKFVPPALDRAVVRPALLAALASIRAPTRWLTAPSGAGKSTLLASYSSQFEGPTLWYQLEDRDNDPKFFFDALADCFVQSTGSWEGIARFTDDDRGNEDAFVSRVLSSVLPRLTSRALLVFDDLQVVQSEATLRALMGLVLSNHQKLALFFLSQEAPPSSFSPAFSRGRLASCCDIDLRFTPEECDVVAGSLPVAISGETLRTLTGGHAGAFVLACELARGRGYQLRGDGSSADTLHLFLLERLLDILPASQRDLMLHCCWLAEWSDDLVNEVLQRDEAGSDLQSLAERGLLLVHRHDGKNVFVPHALVARASRELARRGDFEPWLSRCAAVLKRLGLHEQAFDLLVSTGRLDDALPTFRHLAQKWACERRSDLVLAALAQLPAEQVSASAEICLWVGHALLGVNEKQALLWFGKACAAARDCGDRERELLAHAASLIAFALNSAYGPKLEGAIERLNTLRRDQVVGALGNQAQVVQVALLAARLFGPPECVTAKDARGLVDQLTPLLCRLAAWPTPHLQMAAAVVVLVHTQLYEGVERARQAALAMMPLVADSQASALLRGRWWEERALLYGSDNDLTTFNRCLDELDALAKKGFPQLRFQRLRLQCVVAMRLGSVAEAASLLPEMEQLAEQLSSEDQREFGRLSAGVLLLNGRPRDALLRAEAAVGPEPLNASNAGPRRLAVLEYAHALAANGQPERAGVTLRHLMSVDPGSDHADFRSSAFAYEYMASGESDLRALRLCMQEAASGSNYRLLQRSRSDLARLCNTALREGIETSFLQEMIKRRKLVPPAAACADWPWPVRVHALGAFRLELNGAPYRTPHKAQDKVLDLLKLLVAAQVLANGVAERSWITDRLWPESDGVRARKALEMSVTRLRRLLVSDAAVMVSEGRVTLSPEVVWTDVRALAESLGRVQALRDARVNGLAIASADAGAEVKFVVGLLRGRFLDADDESAWVMGARAQLSRKVRTVLLDCLASFSDDQGAEWVSLVEAALRSDPSSEELTRVLMHHYLNRGEHGEALQAYRRCRDMLMAEYGVSPSADTEALRRAIQVAAGSVGVTSQKVMRA